MYRKAAIALVLLAIASTEAHLYAKSQVYQPVVRIEMPDGLKMTAFLPETGERLACGAANERFVEPFKQQCTDCKVAAARCERRELGWREGATKSKSSAQYPVVVAIELRIVVEGPSDAAKASCQIVAADLVSRGLHTAYCVPGVRGTPAS